MMNGPEYVTRLPNDIGGTDSAAFSRADHEMAPWEKRCHALADVLDLRKIINTEEKRKGVEALGESLIGKLSYYERWIVTFATISFTKGFFAPSDLAEQMAEVEARFARDTAA
jgi:hypothetical protein